MKTLREYITENVKKNKSKRLAKKFDVKGQKKKQRYNWRDDPMHDVVRQHGGHAPDSETAAERRKRYS